MGMDSVIMSSVSYLSSVVDIIKMLSLDIQVLCIYVALSVYTGTINQLCFFFSLHADKCADLDTLSQETGVIINGYEFEAPALEGLNVSFSCPPGLELNGPNTTTCMENGEWEPDPFKLKCEGIV